MKRIIALVLCAAVLLSAPCYAAEFTDIKDEKTATAAATLQSMGVVDGTGSGYAPDQNLTRAQVCKILVNTMGISSQVASYTKKTIFSDVLPGAWYTGYVNLAYSKGIIYGYGNGRFGPNDTVTYGQLATMVLRMLGYQSSDVGSVWPTDYTDLCEELEISDGLGLDPRAAINRGKTAIIVYRALTASTKNGMDYYKTINGIASYDDVIILDTDAADGGTSGKLMVYELNGSGVAYYSQQRTVSSALTGTQGKLLFDTAGKICGFIPLSADYEDITIEKVDSSSVTAKGGQKYRLNSSVTVTGNGESYSFAGNGSVRLSSNAGKGARLFFSADGAVTYVVLSAGSGTSGDAAVASTSSAADSIIRGLGLTVKNYSITKNGAASQAGDLALYDVGYYDRSTDTLRVSDYRVCGYIEDADPGFSNAESITVGGRSFEVLSCALDELSDYTLGSKVVLLLTDDLKVASVRPADFSCEMTGVLSADGRSVTLCGSGISLSAAAVDRDAKAAGSLVTVSFTDRSTMRCKCVGTKTADGSLKISERTVGSLSLAAYCSIYEWASDDAYVYDLEGVQGRASEDLSAITWTDTILKSDIAYYHLNSAGKLDILVLEDVTGNCYRYGKITRYTGNAGINLGTNQFSAYNDAVTVTNANGSTQKAICPVKTEDSYMGIALSGHSSGNAFVKKAASLYSFSQNDSSKFIYYDDCWYAVNGTDEVPISDEVQIYYPSVEKWVSGSDRLVSLLSDSYKLTLYYDRNASAGGKVRVIVAE